MASTKVSAAITYEKPGTQPPMYVAGTFSDPPWEAHEMEYDTDDKGEHIFSQKVEGEPGSKIQYKFRVGPGNWWVLHEGMPTVTDINGNTNHELEFPQPGHPTPGKDVQGEDVQEKDVQEKKTTEKEAPEKEAPEKKVDEEDVPEKQANPEEQTQTSDAGVSFANFSRLPNPFAAPTKRDKNSDDNEASDGDMISPKTARFGADRAKYISPEGPSPPTHSRVAALAGEAATADEVADSAALVNAEKPETPVPDDVAGQIGYRRMSSTPINEVANTAAEVADSARELDKAEVSKLRPPSRGKETDDEKPVIEFEIRPDPREGQNDDFLGYDDEVVEQAPPLFAHECIGMYDDGDDAEDKDAEERDFQYEVETHDQSEVDDDNVDLNDPTLERFPSDRDEIIDAVRKLETGLEEDQPSFEGVPLSPVFPTARRGSEDPVADLLLTPIPVSPIIPRINKRLDLSRSPRLSASSNHPSMASLHSISEAEEPTPGEETRISPVVLLSTPLNRSPFEPPGSDEDEGVSLKETEATKAKAKKGDIPSTGDLLQEQASNSTSETEETEGAPTNAFAKDTITPLEVPEAREPTPQGSPRIVIETADSVEASIERGTLSGENGQGKAAGVDRNSGDDANGQAVSTSADAGNARPRGGPSQLRKRDGPQIERSGTPISVHSAAIPVAKEGGWFRAFFRLLFVDWIGGFISKLCGNRRHT